MSDGSCLINGMLVQLGTNGARSVRVLAALDPFHSHDKPRELDEKIMSAERAIVCGWRGLMKSKVRRVLIVVTDGSARKVVDRAAQIVDSSKAQIESPRDAAAGLRMRNCFIVR